MISVPLDYGLLLAASLFAAGLVVVLVRRNLIFMLMGIEVMLSAAGLAFVVAGAGWGQADGQVMFILILTLAGSEAAVGLALILQLDRHFNTVDADAVSVMRG